MDDENDVQWRIKTNSVKFTPISITKKSRKCWNRELLMSGKTKSGEDYNLLVRMSSYGLSDAFGNP